MGEPNRQNPVLMIDWRERLAMVAFTVGVILIAFGMALFLLRDATSPTKRKSRYHAELRVDPAKNLHDVAVPARGR